MQPALHPAEDVFRAVASAVLPTDPPFDEASARIVDEALVARPIQVRKKIVAFLRLLEWLAFARHGTRLTRMSRDRRIAFLASIQESRFALLRTGFWGVRTLAMLGYYGKPTMGQQLGYRPHPDGWSARRPQRDEGVPEALSPAREKTSSRGITPMRPADLAPEAEASGLFAGREPTFFEWVDSVPRVPLADPPSLVDLFSDAMTPMLRGQSIGDRDEALLLTDLLTEPAGSALPEAPVSPAGTDPGAEVTSSKRSRKKKKRQSGRALDAPQSETGGTMDVGPKGGGDTEYTQTA